jgi:hypothetical protein
LSLATTALVLGSFVMMGMNLKQPTLQELQAYERCVQQGVQTLVSMAGKKQKEPSWTCYEELRPALSGPPAEVLDGLSDLMRQPDVPGGQDRLKALIDQHSTWLEAEARRFGLGR